MDEPPTAFVAWPDFMRALRWRQGEHLSIVGPTGAGKSYLTSALLAVREAAGGSVCVLGTKPRDAQLDTLVRRRGYTRIHDWPPKLPFWRRPDDEDWQRRLLLWPRFEHKDDRAVMGGIFDHALTEMFAAGRWCVVVDEAYWMCADLGLRDWLVTCWTQGRSLGLTVVACTQRPAWVPLWMFDQASHLFFFADADEQNLRRVSGLGGLSSAWVRRNVASLGRHDVLYVDVRRRRLARTRVERETA